MSGYDRFMDWLEAPADSRAYIIAAELIVIGALLGLLMR